MVAPCTPDTAPALIEHADVARLRADITSNPVKFLILDRDTKFTAAFDAIFAADAMRVIRTPVQALGPTPSAGA